MIEILKNIFSSQKEERKINFDLDLLAGWNCTDIGNLQELPQKDQYSIAFIVPGMTKYSGGHTSVLRLGTYLESFNQKVFYLTYDNSSKEILCENAKYNLPQFKGTVLSKDEISEFHFDVGVATLWLSCYFLLGNKSNFSYLAYFIQDYEPFFYPMGEMYHLALNTYKLGFHMISLGKWNKEMIQKDVNDVKVDTIDFPVELKQYQISEKRIDIKKIIKIAVYIKDDPKRAPNFLFLQLKYMADRLKDISMEVDIRVFGLKENVKLPVGTNYRMLNHKDLMGLYGESDFGLVASITNISLVNYEMIACGLPVIDFKEGSAPTYFSEEEMIFINFRINSLYEKILYYVDNRLELQKIVDNAQAKLKNLSWERSSRQFLRSLVGNK